MNKLRVAVIGCGRILSVYQDAFRQMQKEIQLVLAMDKDISRAHSLAGEYLGCKASDDVSLDSFRLLMRQYKPDVLHILLPHHLHCCYAIAAMEEGVNVLTEKPIAISLNDADLMIKAEQETQKQLGVIFQNRYIDGVQHVKELIHSGEFGSVQSAYSTLHWFRPESYYECDWKGKWETEGGGVVIDQAIHSIDLIRYMTGLEAVEIKANVERRVLKKIEVEDVADAAIVLENGAVYSFFACNYNTANSPIRIEVNCVNGSALLTHDCMEISWKDGRKEVISPNNMGLENKSPAYWGAFHKVQIQKSYEALLSGNKMPWTPQDAKKTLEIVQGIYLSSKIGATVFL